MYQISDKAVIDLLTASKILQAKLTQSPLWPLLKDEPPVMNFIESLLAFEKEVGIKDEKNS